MRLVVATLPDVKFSLGRDIALAKLSALYGDKAVLISPTYLGTEPFLDFPNRPVLHQLIYLSILFRDPGFVQGQKLTRAQRASKIKSAEERSNALIRKAMRWAELTLSTGAQKEEYARERDEIANEANTLVQRIHNLYSDDRPAVRRARELRKAEELGLIQIQQIHEKPSLYYNEARLITNITSALSEPDAYGVIDERLTTSLEQVSESQIQKQKITQIAHKMFQKLPLFEQATFEEIRDIKQELEKYISNFRRGVVEVSQKIRSQPWDNDFPHDVEIELTARLLPEIAAIEDRVKSNSYLKELIHRAAKDPLIIPASSAVGMILSTSLQASTIASQVASSLAGLGLLAFEAHKEWKEEKKKAEENTFYFYYSLGTLLDRQSSKP